MKTYTHLSPHYENIHPLEFTITYVHMFSMAIWVLGTLTMTVKYQVSLRMMNHLFNLKHLRIQKMMLQNFCTKHDQDEQSDHVVKC